MSGIPGEEAETLQQGAQGVAEAVAPPVRSPVPRARRGVRRSRHVAQFAALFRRELMTTFLSPMTYLVWGVFLVATGYLFATSVRDGGQASMGATFNQMAMLLVFATPLLTMRLVAEELRLGTLEVLLSDPVSETTIILSKYSATVVFLAVMLLPTLAYPVVLGFVGNPDTGPLLTGYLGLVLMGGLFLAVGLMTSAATGHQIAAAALAFTVLFMMWILGRAAETLSAGVLRDVLAYASAFSQYGSFRRGVLDTRALVYCQTLTSFCLFLAVQFLTLRRLR